MKKKIILLLKATIFQCMVYIYSLWLTVHVTCICKNFTLKTILTSAQRDFYYLLLFLFILYIYFLFIKFYLLNLFAFHLVLKQLWEAYNIKTLKSSEINIPNTII